jgi:hypothetical protein
MLAKSGKRNDEFLEVLSNYDTVTTTNMVVGPVHGLLTHISTIGAQLKAENGDLIVITELGAAEAFCRERRLLCHSSRLHGRAMSRALGKGHYIPEGRIQ